MRKEILCSISTRGRYETTLPLAIQSVICQTKKPDKLVIFDDNDKPIDVRELQIYQYLFQMLTLSGIEWEWVYAERKGQHFNHQRANFMGYDWVWRLDDDTVAEPTTLETLFSYVDDTVGAVGGSILTPPIHSEFITATGKIEDINNEPNLQWGYIKSPVEVDHLHCSFLYRAGVYSYNLGLSRIAHREETLFTYGLKTIGYKILVVPAITWHLKNQVGGIRDGAMEMFQKDELVFQNFILTKSSTIVVLDCGIGDHIVFKSILPELKQPVSIFSCYPEIVPGRSIYEAKTLLGDEFENYNIYRKMDEWDWKGSLADAFRKQYL